MKKSFFIILLTFFGFQVQSQVLLSLIFGDALNSDGLEFGLQGGVNWSSMSGLESSDANANFNLGFYFDIKLKEHLSLYTGVMVKQNVGAGNLTDNDIAFLQGTLFADDGDYNQVTNFFYVPILLRYKFDNNFFLEAGPQIGYRRNAYVRFTNKSDDREADIRDFNDDLFNRLEFGMTGGIGYQYNKGIGMTIMLKYYQAMTEAMKDFSGYKNNGLFLTVGVPIGAGKGKKKAAENDN